MDRRIKKTKNRLKQELVGLLREKPLNRISVTELCDRAELNRSTFYLHYTDVYDLYRHLEESLYGEFKNALEKHMSQDTGWLDDILSPRQRGRLDVLTEVLRFIKKNAAMYGFLLPENRGNAFLQKLYEFGRETFLSALQKKKPEADLQLFEYYYAFVATGCVGVISAWARGGMQESPEALGELIEEIIYRGRRIFQ